jgi:hypothetical protein
MMKKRTFLRPVPFSKRGMNPFLRQDDFLLRLMTAIKNLDMSEGTLQRKGGVKKPAEKRKRK